MKQSPEVQHQRVIKLIDLSEQTVQASSLLPEDEKQLYLGDYQANRTEADDALKSKNSAMLRQLETEILTPWNETSDADSQHFWKLVKEAGLDAKQENHAATILKRGRIATQAEYELVQDSLVIWQQEGQITKQQADQLSSMIATFETKQQ